VNREKSGPCPLTTIITAIGFISNETENKPQIFISGKRFGNIFAVLFILQDYITVISFKSSNKINNICLQIF
jgi:hypothetical protein